MRVLVSILRRAYMGCHASSLLFFVDTTTANLSYPRLADHLNS
ncbi:MAG TPA: hypothetical protein VJ969_00630 [Desulfopila sp.]|nr:hypothetical protein [Desulfopila sp.]